MARIRKQRVKAASPNQVMATTVGLLTPQEGIEVKSTTIHYRDINQHSKLYEHLKDYVDRLNQYHTAKYALQQSGYRLQVLLDPQLVKAGEITTSKEWTFSLSNKQYGTRQNKDGTEESYLRIADIHCADNPGKDFTQKLKAYLPKEKASELGLGIDLGEINQPLVPSKLGEQDAGGSSAGSAEGTENGTDDGTDDRITMEDAREEYRKIRGMPARLSFFMDKIAEEDRSSFLLALKKTERRSLHDLLDAPVQGQIAHTLDEPDDHIPSPIRSGLR